MTSRHLALAALLLLGCEAEPALDPPQTEAALTINPNTQIDDADILQPSLGRFAPKALRDGGNIELYAVGQHGISVRRWFGSSKKWNCAWYGFGHDAQLADPTPIGNDGDAGWDSSLVVWKPSAGGAQRSVAFGFRGTPMAPGWVALHSLDLAARTRTFSKVPTTWHMSTQTGFVDGSAFRLFGDKMANGFPLRGYPATDVPLEDLLVPPATQVERHDAPQGADDEVVVGPGGAAPLTCGTGARNLVAVADTLAVAGTSVPYALAQNGLFLWQESNRTYTSLGAPTSCDDPFFCPTPPPAAGAIFGAPLSVTFTEGGNQRLNVFATASDLRSHQFRLYEKPTWGCDFNQPSWSAYGAPPGVGPDVPFVMTSYVVWNDGPTQRINVFGYTRHDDSNNLPGRLISLYWDGAWWWWDVTRTVPDNGDFVTTSAAMIDEEAYDRLAVYGRSSTGRVWELSWTAAGGWKWTDLTKVEKYCLASQVP